jgi:hypothetical protein
MNEEVNAGLSRQLLAFLQRGVVPPALSRSARYRFIAHAQRYTLDPARPNGLMSGGHPVILRDAVEATLQALWNDPSVRVGGRDRFYEKVQDRYAGITKARVSEFLGRQVGSWSGR